MINFKGKRKKIKKNQGKTGNNPGKKNISKIKKKHKNKNKLNKGKIHENRKKLPFLCQKVSLEKYSCNP